MPGLRALTQPATFPVPLQMVKNHMKVDTVDDDDLIKLYLGGATEKIEGFLGRSLICKSFVQSFDRFPRLGDCKNRDEHPLQIKLARSPLVQVSRINYMDLSGASQTLVPRVDRTWQAETIYTVGNQILDPNGNIQEVLTGEEEGGLDPSTSGDNEPTWRTDSTPVADGEITWLYKGSAPTGDFLVDLNAEPGRIYPNVINGVYPWPATRRVPNAVQVYFIAGYGQYADAVPPIFKTPLMIYTKGLYDFRDPLLTTPGAAPQELPSHLKDLLWEHRIKDFNPTPG